MESRKITVNGSLWHVVSHGDGPPVLFLHGFTGSAQSWELIMEEMGSRFHCIAIDFLGHGQSDAPADSRRYAMDHIIGDLLQVMDTLGHRTFFCVGYSMGGRVALALACSNPERIRALVLESTSPGLKTAEERAARVASDEALAAKVERLGVTRFVDEWQALPLFASQKRLPQPVLARQRLIRCQHSAQGLAGSLRGMGTGAQPSYWNALSELSMPVLLVTGEYDEKFRRIGLDMSKRIEGAETIVIQEAGHTVHLERPVDYVRTIRSFLLTIL